MIFTAFLSPFSLSLPSFHKIPRLLRSSLLQIFNSCFSICLSYLAPIVNFYRKIFQGTLKNKAMVLEKIYCYRCQLLCHVIGANYYVMSYTFFPLKIFLMLKPFLIQGLLPFLVLEFSCLVFPT